MAWKSSSYSSSSHNYARNQAPYVAPEPQHPSSQATQLRSLNHAEPHSGARWSFCPSCKNKLEKDARFCHECGRDVEKVQLVIDLIPTKCVCNRTLKKEFKYCPNCKAVVDKTWETIPACSCGTILEIEANACTGCGKKPNNTSTRRKTD